MLNRGSCALRLFHARHALTVLNQREDLAKIMGFTGSQSPEILDGLRILDTAEDAYYLRQAKFADALAVTDTRDAAFKDARAAQARLTALARIMITTPSDRDRLGLNGRRSEVLGRWLIQAGTFHQNLTDADRAQLARVGVHAAELDAVHQRLIQLARHHADYVAAKAEAKAATEAKTLAFKDLARVMSQITTMVRTLEPTVPDLAEIMRMKPDGRRKQTAPQEEPEPQPTPELQIPPAPAPPQTPAKPRRKPLQQRRKKQRRKHKAHRR